MGEPVSKKNFQAALERKWQQQIKQHQDREAFELRKNKDLDNSTAHSSPTPHRSDWGATIDVSFFYGRSSELAILEQWIQVEPGRAIAIWGLGGVGKTALAVKVGQQIQGNFDRALRAEVKRQKSKVKSNLSSPKSVSSLSLSGRKEIKNIKERTRSANL